MLSSSWLGKRRDGGGIATLEPRSRKGYRGVGVIWSRTGVEGSRNSCGCRGDGKVKARFLCVLFLVFRQKKGRREWRCPAAKQSVARWLKDGGVAIDSRVESRRSIAFLAGRTRRECGWSKLGAVCLPRNTKRCQDLVGLDRYIPVSIKKWDDPELSLSSCIHLYLLQLYLVLPSAFL